MLNKWKSTLRELENDLSVNEKMWSLIREIDREIILAANNKQDDIIEQVISTILEKFFGLHNWPKPSIMLVIDQVLGKSDSYSDTSETAGDKAIFNTDKTGIASASQAIICNNKQPYFLITSEVMPDNNGYHEVMLDTYKNILLQLEALLSAHLVQHYIQVKKDIYDSFFSSELRPSECWSAIANGALEYVPRWSGSELQEDTLVQVLLYEEGDRLIKVIGSNDPNEALNRYVRVDLSVTGAAISNPRKPWLLVNPIKEKGRVNYIGYRKDIPQSELVILLRHGESVIGALNIENRNENAFSPFHIRELCNYATFISPVVHSLNERHRAYYKKTVSLTYAYSDMLGRLRKTYRHLLGQPMSIIGSGVAEIKYQLKGEPNIDNKQVILEEVLKIQSSINDINQHTLEFFTNVPNYLDKDKVSVLDCINERLGYLTIQAEEEGIDITVSCSSGLSVYASRFLQEHIFNIVKNSFDSVLQRRRKGDIASGIIKITADEVEEQDALSNQMHLRTVRITVVDNGGGGRMSLLSTV